MAPKRLRFVVLAALFAPVLPAQSVSSSIDGSVVDVTRAAVPSADVVLTNLETGATIKTATGAAGSYAFPSIQLHDSFSWLRGKHLLKIGVDLNYVRSLQDSANAYARAQIVCNNLYTPQLTTDAQGALVPVAGSGNTFADFFLGLPAAA